MARLRGLRWQADVILDGKRVRKSFASKEDANKFERDSERSAQTLRKIIFGSC